MPTCISLLHLLCLTQYMRTVGSAQRESLAIPFPKPKILYEF